MIDVVIVNYEGGAMVLEAIKASLASHTRGDLRFIIIDNGSQGAAHAALFRNPRLAALLGGVRKTSARAIDVRVPFECIHESDAKIPVITAGHDLRTVRVTARWTSRRGDLLIKLDRNHGYETGVNVALAAGRRAGFSGAPDLARWQGSSPRERAAIYRAYCAWLRGPRARPHHDVVLLGSDVRPHARCFTELARTARLHPRIGLVGAKLVQRQAGGLFVVGGGYVEAPELRHRTGWDAAGGPWHTFQNCPWVTFSCVYVARACLSAVGTMDMRLFPYGGDVDYSRRARLKGFASVFCPTASALHQHESRTVVRVMRAMPSADWIARTAASQRYFFLKWAERRVPRVTLPAGVFAPLQDAARPSLAKPQHGAGGVDVNRERARIRGRAAKIRRRVASDG